MPHTVQSPAARDDRPTETQTSANTHASIQVQWRTATQEIMQLVASLTDEQKMALGTNALMTGQDVYAIHVRIANNGSVPVDVSPERLRLTYNGTAIPLMSADDQRFLRSVELQPNHFTQGILTFKTSILIGGAILASGRLFYDDPGVEVTFPQ